MPTKTATAATSEPAEQAVVDDKKAEQQAQDDFDAGAAMETTPEPKPAAQGDGPPRDDNGRFIPSESKEEKPAAKKDEPEYVKVTKADFEKFMNTVKRTDDFEKQMSKAFGTIGDVQKIVRTLQSGTPRGAAIKIPDGAFADMERDFPDLAKQTRAALEATLKGMEGTGSASAQVDVEAFDKKMDECLLQLQTEALEDEFPDWAKIVGAVDVRKGEKPDDNNAFRKWLTTKDQAYQTRVNTTNSAGVITRAIRMFQSETKKAVVPAKQEASVETRSSRIRDAIRPKGDGGHPPLKDSEDEFEAGFKTG